MLRSRIAGKFFSLLLFTVLLVSCLKQERHRILVFSKTTGYRHVDAIAAGKKALLQLGAEHGFIVDTTEDAAVFNEEDLKHYRAVVFLNASGDILNEQEQNSFQRFIQAGGGFLGIHGPTDAERDWPWYGKLIGAYFDSHPNNPNVRKGRYWVIDKNHLATKELPDHWVREDEFYNFRIVNPAIKPLITIDESSYQGGNMGTHHPMVWYHEYDGGRMFYTAMGHTVETYTDPLFLKMITGALQYVTGGQNPNPLAYEKVRTKKMPDENRFNRHVLLENLTEPMELAVAKDGRIFFIERKGTLLVYNRRTNTRTVLGTIPVTTQYEDGLLGITLDPDFVNNHFLYLMYSAFGGLDEYHVSRFALRADGTLDLKSEKILLRIHQEHPDGNHTGGSLMFDPRGNGDLFIAIGDNTNPRVDGFTPIDERPGRIMWDAQRSAGNTNDLRGKILRIHPELDGTYTIPNGNLFPKGTPKTRPEIYTMGHRQPFRFSIDSKTGWLYWGEIGPDSNVDSLDRGPRGYDEFNQARQPGNYGWPYFVGDNKAYNDYDFETRGSGKQFDPAKPVNNSPNNSGLTELPPAKKAFIWYPYANSVEFPLVGTGGRSAMGGPVFHRDDLREAQKLFPDYYEGKWFIYEWMRGWIMTVSFDREGNYESMERFMPGYKFSNPIDMEFGADGNLYLLEYGNGWFTGNPDARLICIEYNEGNRVPVVKTTVDKNVGSSPLHVHLSSAGTIDHDKDDLSYEWEITNSKKQVIESFTTPQVDITLYEPGIYTATLVVTDEHDGKSSSAIKFLVGNEPPSVSVNITKGNKTFFFEDNEIAYQTHIKDKEDGSLATGGIDPEGIKVKIKHLTDGYDLEEISHGHLISNTFLDGKFLLAQSDCKACHSLDKRSIGPTWIQIADRYRTDGKAEDKLVSKVISGGSGVWGSVPMSAHPEMPAEDVKEIIRYILSTSSDDPEETNLAASGTYLIASKIQDKGKGIYVLNASYTDRGANGMPAQSAITQLVLRNPRVYPAEANKLSNGIRQIKAADPSLTSAIVTKTNAYLAYTTLDVQSIAKIEFSLKVPKAEMKGGTIEIRLDSPEGKLWGQRTEIVPTQNDAWRSVDVKVDSAAGMHDVYFVFKNADLEESKPLFEIAYILFSTQLPRQ